MDGPGQHGKSDGKDSDGASLGTSDCSRDSSVRHQKCAQTTQAPTTKPAQQNQNNNGGSVATGCDAAPRIHSNMKCKLKKGTYNCSVGKGCKVILTTILIYWM